MEKIYTCKTVEETKKLGYKLGLLAQSNMVFTMSGDLGAGKTTLTQGIAKGLGIERTVSSPTFTILKVYEGRLTLYHFDAYRLEGVSHDLGFEEMIDGDGLVVIEWSQYISELVQDEYLEISINYIDEQVRNIKLTAHGSKYEQLLEEI